MKTIKLLLLLNIVMMGILRAQVPPQAFNYSGIARNSSDNIMANTTIGLELMIMDEYHIPFYVETFTTGTDAHGLFTVQIGQGAVTSVHTFHEINWGSGPKYLNVWFSETGTYPFTNLDTIPFLSVPYALLAGSIHLPYIDSISYLTNIDAYTNPAFQILYKGGPNKGAIKGVFQGTEVNGIGVHGVSSSPNGYGVVGVTTGEHGSGVHALATSPMATGLYAVSEPTGQSGVFSGGKVSIENNPPAINGTNLNITRNGGTEAANIRLTSAAESNGNYWQLDAVNTTNNEKFSISHTGTELFKIAQNGNINFNGALIPNNNVGMSGQVLTSSGGGPNTWSTLPVSIYGYNNTFLYDQWTATNLSTTETIVASGQLSGNTFSIGNSAKVIIHFSHSKILNGPVGSGNTKVRLVIELINNTTNVVINQAELFELIPNGELGNVAFIHHCQLSPGTYKVNIKGQIISGDTDISMQGISGNSSPGQLSIQVIQQ